MKLKNFLSLLVASLIPVLPAVAQTYPNRPMRMIVPFPAGGASDILARVLSQKLGAESSGGTPQAFAAMVKADNAKWIKIITERKITAE